MPPLIKADDNINEPIVGCGGTGACGTCCGGDGTDLESRHTAASPPLIMAESSDECDEPLVDGGDDSMEDGGDEVDNELKCKGEDDVDDGGDDEAGDDEMKPFNVLCNNELFNWVTTAPCPLPTPDDDIEDELDEPVDEIDDVRCNDSVDATGDDNREDFLLKSKH